MNDINQIKQTIIPPSRTRPFCVWYCTGATGEDLDDVRFQHQVNQDLLVVQAPNATQAAFEAEALLHARCEFDYVITKVADRAALERVLTRVLAAVEQGALPPASLDDADHYVWATRYLYCE